MQSDPHQDLKTKGKVSKYNLAATKWTDGKQSWQLFPKKVATLLPKLNRIYLKLI